MNTLTITVIIFMVAFIAGSIWYVYKSESKGPFKNGGGTGGGGSAPTDNHE